MAFHLVTEGKATGPLRAAVALLLIFACRPCVCNEGVIQGNKETTTDTTISFSGLHGTLKLNHQLFSGNVLSKDVSYHPEHFVVYFCPEWWEPCKKLMGPFTSLGSEWENKLNDALMERAVRFAWVDCAIDKVLCNQQDVETYPTVNHYTNGELVTQWTGNGRNDDKRLAKWLNSELGDARRASERGTSSVVDSATEVLTVKTSSRAFAVDLGLIVLVLLVNLMAVSRNPDIWQTARECLQMVQGLGKGATPVDSPVVEQESEPEDMVKKLVPQDWVRQRQTIEL